MYPRTILDVASVLLGFLRQFLNRAVRRGFHYHLSMVRNTLRAQIWARQSIFRTKLGSVYP